MVLPPKNSIRNLNLPINRSQSTGRSTTWENDWPFGSFARKMANGQQLIHLPQEWVK